MVHGTAGVERFLRKEGIQALYLNYTKGWTGRDLDFLSQCPRLTKLKVLDWDIRHLSSILCLTSSRSLLEAAVEDGVHLVE